jgi:hypothetical protein
MAHSAAEAGVNISRQHGASEIAKVFDTVNVRQSRSD